MKGAWLFVTLDMLPPATQSAIQIFTDMAGDPTSSVSPNRAIDTRRCILRLAYFADRSKAALNFEDDFLRAFLDHLRTEGVGEERLRQIQRCLNHFMRETGVMLDPQSVRLSRTLVNFDDIPQAWRDRWFMFQADGLDKKKLNQVKRHLCRLAGALIDAGHEPEEIDDAALAVYRRRLSEQGLQRNAIYTTIRILKTFRNISDAYIRLVPCENVSTDQIHALLAAKHWRPYRERAWAFLQAGAPFKDLGLLDRFLRAPRVAKLIEPAVVRDLVGDDLETLNRLHKALQTVQPRSPELRVIELVTQTIRAEQRPPPSRYPVHIERVVEALPSDVSTVILTMHFLTETAEPDVSPAWLKAICSELLTFNEIIGIKRILDILDTNNIGKFYRWRQNNLSNPNTLRGRAERLLAFVLRVEPRGEAAAALRRIRNGYSRLGKRRESETVKAFRDNPVSYDDIVQALDNLTAAASSLPETERPRAFRSNWLSIIAIVLLQQTTIRVADLLKLRIGITILRDEDGWFMNDIIQKSATKKELLFDRIPYIYTNIIDAAILFGARFDDQEVFQRLYDLHRGQFLFANWYGQPFGSSWIWWACVRAYSHGPHSMRRIAHRAIGSHPKLGAVYARAACRQKDEKMSSVYETGADCARAQTAEARLRDAEADIINVSFEDYVAEFVSIFDEDNSSEWGVRCQGRTVRLAP